MKLKSLRQNFHSRNHHVYHCQLRVLDTDLELQMLMTSLLLHVLPDFQIWKMYSPANSQIWKMYYQNLIFLRQKWRLDRFGKELFQCSQIKLRQR